MATGHARRIRFQILEVPEPNPWLTDFWALRRAGRPNPWADSFLALALGRPLRTAGSRVPRPARDYAPSHSLLGLGNHGSQRSLWDALFSGAECLRVVPR